MSDDPLRDPRFPDRPQSQDFWRLSDVVLQLDGKATEGNEPAPAIAKDLIDVEALAYMAKGRTSLGSSLKVNDLAVLWMDGFIAGLLFQKAGGHRDG